MWTKFNWLTIGSSGGRGSCGHGNKLSISTMVTEYFGNLGDSWFLEKSSVSYVDLGHIRISIPEGSYG
jgi:hypothetical protein